MANERRWEWDKQGDLDGHANFHHELPAGVTLSSPTAELHERTATNPVTYTKIVSEGAEAVVTIAASVVTAMKDKDTEETGGAGRGVRVVITKDPDDQPDVTDEPTPGTDYRVKIIATRSDSGRPIAREVPLTILP